MQGSAQIEPSIQIVRLDVGCFGEVYERLSVIVFLARYRAQRTERPNVPGINFQYPEKSGNGVIWSPGLPKDISKAVQGTDVIGVLDKNGVQ
jgi:hypothetical protein